MEKTYNVLYTYVPGPKPEPGIKLELVTDCQNLSVNDNVVWYNAKTDQYLTFINDDTQLSTVTDPNDARQFYVATQRLDSTSNIYYVVLRDTITDKQIRYKTSSPYEYAFGSTGTSAGYTSAYLMVTNIDTVNRKNSDNRICIFKTASSTNYKFIPTESFNGVIMTGSRLTATSSTNSVWQLYKVIQQ